MPEIKQIVRLLIILLILLSFSKSFACFQDPIRIPVEFKKGVSKKASEIFNRATLIPLETTKDCLIERIMSIYYYNHKLYVQCNERKNLFIFSDNGKFLKNVVRFGKGPGEAIEISAFLVNKDKNRIEVFSSQSAKIIYYDLNGNFLSEKSTFLNFESFIKPNSNTYCYYTGSRTNIINNERRDELVFFTDTLLNIQKSFFPDFIWKKHGLLNVLTFSETNRKGVFNLLIPYWDTIYRIDGTNFTKSYLLDFKDKKIKWGSFKGSKPSRLVEELHYSKFAFCHAIFYEFDRMIFSEILYSSETYFVFFDKITGKSETIRVSDFINDINGISFLDIYGYAKNTLITAIESYAFLEFINSIKNGKGTDLKLPDLDDLYRLSAEVNNNNNPIVMLLTMK
jgi:hypothetical protein